MILAPLSPALILSKPIHTSSLDEEEEEADEEEDDEEEEDNLPCEEAPKPKADGWPWEEADNEEDEE
jgi:hypothetical protein